MSDEQAYPYDLGRRVNALEQRTERLDSRVGHLETQEARHEEKLVGVNARLSGMATAGDLALVAQKLTTLTTSFQAFVENYTEREVDERRERRATRRAMWALVVSIGCALIAAGAVILSTGSHP